MLVGRADELRRLDTAVSDAVDGCGSALLVMGAPGAGVTAVLDAAARRAAPRVRIIRARAWSGSSDGVLLRDLAAAAGASRSGVDDVVDALRLLVEQGPVALVVDDADRAPGPSLQALAEVVTRVPQLLALVGLAVRVDRVPDPLAGWERLVIGPLGAEASMAVARAAVGYDAPVLQRLVPRLHGNARALHDVPPLLGREVLDRHLALPDDVLPAPPALVEAWADLLPPVGSPAAAALLQAALCEPAPPAVGARALDGEARGELDGCPLIALRQGGAAWIDPWVRDIVVARSDACSVEAAHRALAGAAYDAGRPPAVVAYHLVRSAAGIDDEVADALEVQARRAEALGVPDVAPATWAASSLRTSDPQRRARRAVEGARMLTATGPGMDGLADLLRALDDAELSTEHRAIRDRLRSLQRASLDPDSRITAMQASVASARRSAPELLPDLLWELSVLAGQHGDHEVALAAAREHRALEDSGRVRGRPPWTGRALLAAALLQAGRVAEAEDLRREVHEAAASLDPATAGLELLFDAVALDDLVLDLGADASERLLTLVQRLDGEATVACLYGIQGWRARARGDLATARRMMRDGMAVAVPSAAIDVVCGLGALGAELAAISGDDDELDRIDTTLRPLMAGSGDLRRLSTLDRALGLRALVSGRLEESAVHLAAAAEAPMLGRGLRDGVLMARVDLVEVLVRCDDRAAAQSRADDVLPVLDALTDPLAGALAARVRALVAGTDEECLRILAEAVVRHAAATDAFEQSRTLWLRGTRLRRQRRRAQARADLLAASRLLRGIGARPWLEQVEAELRACGGMPAEPGRGGEGAELTAQELAVARAVALGASNREVAESLFLSPRTVEYHLGNVYRKLGVHGRGGLGARLLVVDPTG